MSIDEKLAKKDLLYQLDKYLVELDLELKSQSSINKVIRYSRSADYYDLVVEVNTSPNEGDKLVLLKFYYDENSDTENKLYVNELDSTTKLNINSRILQAELLASEL